VHEPRIRFDRRPDRVAEQRAAEGVRAVANEDVPASATGIVVVDLVQLRANWQALAKHVAPAECAAVVKADAYGTGAARVIPALVQAGCRSFFVATPGEAVEARALAPSAAIYVLDGLLPGTAQAIVDACAVPVISSIAQLHAWGEVTRSGAGAPPAALHIDTGLHRLGMHADDVAALARDETLMRGQKLALVMSHLACADEAGHPMNLEQLASFKRLRAMLPEARASLAASDGLMLGAPYHFDMVRPGYALYGGQAAPNSVTPVAPVVRVSARILQVHEVPAGGHIGYSATYRAPAPRTIATIAAGYADGVFRHASATHDAPGGAVAIRGQRAPVVGRVSMDLITVDVTGIEGPALEPGEWADLVGPDLPLEDVGAAAGTIGYEVLTRLGRRFHRVYRDA
jgi:alanine racemase